MKRMTLKVILAVGMMCAMPGVSQAQGLLDAVKGIMGSSGAGSVVDAVTDLLGINKVNEKNLVGTWTYSEPCVVFESDNVLTNVGGSVFSDKVEKQLANSLDKVAFTQGAVVITLESDKTGTVAFNGKSASVTWGINESDLTLSFPKAKKEVTMNTKITGSTLQLAMNADKLKTVIGAITEKASKVNSTLAGINTLMKNVDGMYLGMKFTK